MSVTHGGNVWQGAGPGQWLDYSANIRPGGPPRWVIEAMTDAMKYAGYYPDLSMKAAIKGLADFLEVDESLVVPTSGGAAAIEAAAGCGADSLLLGAPCFGEYKSAGEKRGLPVKEVSLIVKEGSGGGHSNGRHIGNPAQILGPHIEKNSLIWICSPMNPAGHCFSFQEIEELLKLAESKAAYLAVDEAFIDYCPGRSVRNLAKDHPDLIITGSMTKILGIPGVRLGYMISAGAPKYLAKKIPWELNCFAEAIAARLPEHRAEMEQEAKEGAEDRKSLEEGLKALGIFVYPGSANFLLCDFGREVDPIAVKLKEKNILVRRCMDFYGINDGRHLRLAVKDKRTNSLFLEALKEILCAENL